MILAQDLGFVISSANYTYRFYSKPYRTRALCHSTHTTLRKFKKIYGVKSEQTQGLEVSVVNLVRDSPQLSGISNELVGISKCGGYSGGISSEEVPVGMNHESVHIIIVM